MSKKGKLERGKHYYDTPIYGKAIEDCPDRVNKGLFFLRKDKIYTIEGFYHYEYEVEDGYIIRMDKGSWEIMNKSRFEIVENGE